MSANPIDADAWRAAEWIYDAVASWPRAKDCAFALVFLRYISEWQQETLTEYRRKYRGDQIRVSRAMSRERFMVPDGCAFQQVLDQSTAADLGEKINIVLEFIQRANSHKLRSVFSRADFNSIELGDVSERNARIRRLLDAVAAARPTVGNACLSEWLGVLANALIIKFAEQAARHREAYFTPPELCKLMTQLVEPTAGDRIYDPACGSGGLLIEAARVVGNRNFALLGHEHHLSTWALCRMNLMFQNMDAVRIVHGDPIRSPISRPDSNLQRFDVVVSDLPFSPVEWDSTSLQHDRFNRFKRGIPPKNLNDYAYISHIVETMDPTSGRACVVTPLGALFRGGSEGLIRRRLIEEGILEGVVRLPSNLFFGTAIPAALLLFRAKRSERSVLFIDASRDFGNDKSRNRLREQDLQKILTTWKARAEETRYARLVSYEEIERNQFNLNIPRYIKTPDDEPIDLEQLDDEISRLDRELAQARTELSFALNRLER